MLVIIDFDSTFTRVEGLDLLAEIALQEHPAREERLQLVRRITELGMNGELSFSASLKERLSLIRPHRRHIECLVERLKEEISPSFRRNERFFQEYAANIRIISSGFREFIEPVVAILGIAPEQVFANRFLFDSEGYVIGYDESIPLAHDQGKVKLLQSWQLPDEEIYVIGDGYTDYEIKAAGLANAFYAFAENVHRQKVFSYADAVLPSLDEFLYRHNLPMRFSYPKNRIKVLLLEGVHPVAVKIFQEEGYQVEYLATALDEEELKQRIGEVSILGIRSKTQLTDRVLAHAKRLIAVGAFCIGTNQIDLDYCTKRGIAVFNAPYSNTRSVVELAIGEMIMLMRGIPDKNKAAHAGRWMKSAKNSHEIRGKKLGIVGYGNIGAQLSVLAEALGMEVYFFDIVDKLPLGNSKACSSLDELLAIADIVSLHVDGRPENRNMIDAAAIAKMKDGAILLNLSRGFVVDVNALADAIRSGKLRGAAVDVFPEEPKSNEEPFESVLQGLPNVILTPHIGGSTQEAQENIGNFVPAKIIDYINRGTTYGSVNLPNLQLPAQQQAHRLLHIHHNVPGILAQINSLLAKHEANILGQYLKTNEQIGYVITDIDKDYNQALINELKSIPQTIRFRVLY
jgi:D-3-phosphoglycerate dehydrogenase